MLEFFFHHCLSLLWSILDPLLFNIFINDLPLENLTSEIDMYADDTTLSINGKIYLKLKQL
jgi:hypothetical protein